MKKTMIIVGILIALTLLFMGFFLFGNQIGVGKPARFGEVVNISIQTSHPYPNNEGGRVLVWSETLEHIGATSLRLHFDKFEIDGRLKTPEIYEEVNYGDCDLNAPPGYTREMVDENTIIQKQIVEESDGDEIRVGGIGMIKCGIAQEKKEFTPQELFDNLREYIEGDFVVIKDKNGNVIDVLVWDSIRRVEVTNADSPRSGWGKTYYDTDILVIELYTDDTENGYGFFIDKYLRGFTEQEIEETNTDENYFK